MAVNALADHKISGQLWLLAACQCVTTLGLMAMVPVMPLYLQRLMGLSLVESSAWASLAVAAPALGSLCMAPYLGLACDRHGYRRLVLLSLTGFTLSMLLMALSPTVHGFLLGRVLLGISGVGVTLMTFASVAAGPHARGRALGLLQAATAGGAFLGPVLGGLLQGTWSLQPLLIATAVLSGAGVLGSALLLREPQSGEPARRATECTAIYRKVIAALATPGVRAWLLAGCGVQAAAFALVVVFVLFLAPLFDPAPGVFDRAAGTHRLFAGVHLSLPLAAGGIHALGWLATALSSPAWGRANDRGNARCHFIAAALGCALCMACMSLANDLWLIGGLRVIQGALFGGLVQTVFFQIDRFHSGRHPGRNVGLCKSYLVLGQIIGPLLVMVLLPAVSPSLLLLVVAALFLVAALLVLPATAPQPGPTVENDRDIQHA